MPAAVKAVAAQHPAGETLATEEIRKMRDALLAWYAAHKRDLPWRATRDPYRIWVSEIMLQQTRVAAVLEHYRRFLEAFPTVQALAAASEPEVLALWSGLGYYRRARMLHRAAKVVAAELGGAMPHTAVGLLALPGVGAYTAAAVASIAPSSSAPTAETSTMSLVRTNSRNFGSPSSVRGNDYALWCPCRDSRHFLLLYQG